MPTILSHPAVPLALGLALGQRVVPPKLLLAGVAASVIPDLDVLAFRFGVPYADAIGHRGLTHSLIFALSLGLIAAALARQLDTRPIPAFALVAASGASHSLLDMLTNGGQGVALWWPLSEERIFFAWQVIEVSPLSLRRFFSAKGFEVLRSELLWIWLPAAILGAGLFAWRRRAQPFVERKGAGTPETKTQGNP